MQAYRAAGLSIPRTSEEQWAWGPQVPADQVQPGDLVFFAGSDGTRASPGHVGIVIGGGKMVEAYATLEVLSRSAISVVILGETGVGKDVFAQALHATSARRDQARRGGEAARVAGQAPPGT